MEELKNIETRAESLARKMNNITNKFKENLDIAEDMDVTGNDIIEFVENKTKELPQSLDDTSYLELINLNTLLQDFDYIRKTLRENAEQGRNIIKSLGIDITASDPEELAGLITSYAELNKSITDTLKLFIQAYKDISTIITNLEKVKSGFNKTTNNLNITNISENPAENLIATTADIIKQIKEHNLLQAIARVNRLCDGKDYGYIVDYRV